MFQFIKPFEDLLLIQLESFHACVQLAPMVFFFSGKQVSPERNYKDGDKDEKRGDLQVLVGNGDRSHDKEHEDED